MWPCVGDMHAVETGSLFSSNLVAQVMNKPTMGVKKQKNPNIAAKLSIVQHVDNREKRSPVSEVFVISRNMLSTLLRNKANIKLEAAKDCFC